MRRAVLGVVAAGGLLAWAGVAAAADYVVVTSTDPALKPGVELDAGQHVPLETGRTATLMAAAGDVTVLRGGPGGATAPTRKGGDPARLAALKVLVSPPTGGRTFGGKRGGVCPDSASLTTLDDILQVQAGGCVNEARQALDALVARESH